MLVLKRRVQEKIMIINNKNNCVVATVVLCDNTRNDQVAIGIEADREEYKVLREELWLNQI